MKRVSPLFILIVFSTFLVKAQNRTVGLQLHTSSSLDSGYILFAPDVSTTTYLIDKCGKTVHTWPSKYLPGLSVYLLPDGSLLRCGFLSNNFSLGGSGAGGIIEKIDWSGKVVWSYKISDSLQQQHHDIEPLPNGNILVLSWEKKSKKEAMAMGRNPFTAQNGMWSEKILELKPNGTNDAAVVWQWHVWDHLIQNYDVTAPNFDSPSQHPELIDINYIPQGMAPQLDWLHINCIKYNPDLDEIMLSIHNWSEIWVIDHHTNVLEAAGHSNGKRAMGGDLLYRWGNPAAYAKGTIADQKFFQQHDAYWIPKGFPYAGKIMVFNNGLGRPGGDYSSVEILNPPVDDSGSYNRSQIPFLPVATMWNYTAGPPFSFYSSLISSAQMLKNGNVLVCSGISGLFFEIDTMKQLAWQYTNPVSGSGPVAQGKPASFPVFRCTYYPFDYKGFKGHQLIAGNPVELKSPVYNCDLSAIVDTTQTHDTTTVHNSGIRTTAAETYKITNPFTDFISINGEPVNGKVSAYLFDVFGNRIETWDDINFTRDAETKLWLKHDLHNGIYFIAIQHNDSQTVFRLMHL
jgi:hypothetical protein